MRFTYYVAYEVLEVHIKILRETWTIVEDGACKHVTVQAHVWVTSSRHHIDYNSQGEIVSRISIWQLQIDLWKYQKE